MARGLLDRKLGERCTVLFLNTLSIGRAGWLHPDRVAPNSASGLAISRSGVCCPARRRKPRHRRDEACLRCRVQARQRALAAAGERPRAHRATFFAPWLAAVASRRIGDAAAIARAIGAGGCGGKLNTAGPTIQLVYTFKLPAAMPGEGQRPAVPTCHPSRLCGERRH